MIGYLKASFLSTVALAVVKEWKSGTELASLVKDRSSVILFADESDRESVSLLFKEVSELDDKWCAQAGVEKRTWVIANKQAFFENIKTQNTITLLPEIFQKGSWWMAKLGEEVGIIKWQPNQDSGYASELQKDIRERLDISQLGRTITCQQAADLKGVAKHSFVMYSTQ